MNIIKKVNLLSPFKKLIVYTVALFSLSFLGGIAGFFIEPERRILQSYSDTQFFMFTIFVCAFYSFCLSFIGIGCELFKDHYFPELSKKFLNLITFLVFFILISVVYFLSIKPELYNSDIFISYVYFIIGSFFLCVVVLSSFGWYFNMKKN